MYLSTLIIVGIAVLHRFCVLHFEFIALLELQIARVHGVADAVASLKLYVPGNLLIYFHTEHVQCHLPRCVRTYNYTCV